MNIAQIMSKTVHTVLATDRLVDLKNIFSSVSYHHLLVEDRQQLVGLVSDRDALANLSPFIGTASEHERDRELLQLQVKDVMSVDLITISSDTLIDTASILLLENNISCLPVVDDRMMIEGIVTWKDILQYHVYGVDTSLTAEGVS